MEVGNLSSLLEVSFALHVGYGTFRSVNHFGITEIERYVFELDKMEISPENNRYETDSVNKLFDRLEEMKKLNSLINIFMFFSLFIAILSIVFLVIGAINPGLVLSSLFGGMLISMILLPMPTFLLIVWVLTKRNRDKARMEYKVILTKHGQWMDKMRQEVESFRFSE